MVPFVYIYIKQALGSVAVTGRAYYGAICVYISRFFS